jgi:FtsH-binding integral membrane protein
MDDKSSKSCSTKSCQTVMWWMTLIVAVLAVPAFGAIVATLSFTSGVVQIAVFILACWFCTYLGMKLMHAPHMNDKIGNKKD